jgi:hypothetical protein
VATAWVLDTGATNHMTVQDIIHFSDDSKARIEGRGTVAFTCKDGERRLFLRCVFHTPADDEHPQHRPV